jgi:OMF family outer membrane factor
MKTIPLFPFFALLLLPFSLAAAPDSPISLEEALKEARAANARLPVAAIVRRIGEERIAEARAERWLKLAIEGDFLVAPASSYDPALTNLGEERLQLTGRQAIFDGGARKAAISGAIAGAHSAQSRYRSVEKDVDLDVRGRYAEFLAAESEIAIRRSGIERLKSYRTSLQSRKRSGQGVAADILKTDVRLSIEQADTLEAERRLDQARIELNDLLGRDPVSALALHPMDPPAAPPAREPDPWANGPEVQEAKAAVELAVSELALARAERRPHLFVSADAGLWGSDTTRWVPRELAASHPGATFSDRVSRDAGYSLALSFSWPLWDSGAAKARESQAHLALEQSRREETARRRESRLQWERARAARENLLRQIEVLSKASPDARDSALEAESRYRGGTATSLEVLEAFTTSIDAEVRLADATARYRLAEALEIRWGTP